MIYTHWRHYVIIVLLCIMTSNEITVPSRSLWSTCQGWVDVLILCCVYYYVLTPLQLLKPLVIIVFVEIMCDSKYCRKPNDCNAFKPIFKGMSIPTVVQLINQATNKNTTVWHCKCTLHAIIKTYIWQAFYSSVLSLKLIDETCGCHAPSATIHKMHLQCYAVP